MFHSKGYFYDFYNSNQKITVSVSSLLSEGTIKNYIDGDSKANKISGKTYSDIIDGYLGNDILSGGTGKDTFVFSTKLSSKNVDKINDFNVKDDTIWLKDDIFTKAGPIGDLKGAAFYVGSKAHDASDRIIYNKSTGDLFYDADGNGKIAAVKFASLASGLAVTAADFDIIS